MILIHERSNPINHVRLAEAVARGPLGPVLDVEHARQRDAITRPVPAVLDEVVGLCGACASSSACRSRNAFRGVNE